MDILQRFKDSRTPPKVHQKVPDLLAKP